MFVLFLRLLVDHSKLPSINLQSQIRDGHFQIIHCLIFPLFNLLFALEALKLFVCLLEDSFLIPIFLFVGLDIIKATQPGHIWEKN